MTILPYALGICLIAVTISMLLCLIRLIIGPSIVDRLLALDTLFLNAICIIIILGIYWVSTSLFEGALLVAMLGFVLTAAAIIATQSRGGLLGVCAVSGLFAWQRVKSKTLLISLGMVALVVLFAAAGISDRASGGAAESGVDASAMGRIYAWQAAWGMALGHPQRDQQGFRLHPLPGKQAADRTHAKQATAALGGNNGGRSQHKAEHRNQ
jgi:multisubunit Na+/H+ antiporter MnhF subunit